MRISDWSSDVCSSDLFPFARGVTQALVGERLDTVPALQRETTHFWNWLGGKPNGKAKSTGRMAWGVTMADGTPVLGNVELKGRALMLAVTSAERAKRGTALIKAQSAPSCDFGQVRSEARRVRKECVSTCRSRGAP